MGHPKWRVCPCNRRYQVSDLGGVRNKKTRIACTRVDNGQGYLRVKLYVGTISETRRGKYYRWFAVHLLVLETFEYARPGPEFEGAHQDGNRSNNKLTNLFWKTKAQNTADRVKHRAERKGVENEQRP